MPKLFAFLLLQLISTGICFRLKLKVLTCDRAESLTRLLNSIASAEYNGDIVDIDFYIDYTKKLRENQVVLKVAQDFQWSHGSKTIHERVINAGVYGQWLEAWSPLSNTEYAFFLEDDLELSPLYYVWLKQAVEKYHNREIYPELYGISLQRQHVIAQTRHPKGSFPVQNGNRLFAYHLLGTWGMLFFPDDWIVFRAWFKGRLQDPSFQPLVPGLITTDWYLELGNKAWEQWVTRWVYETNKYCLYTNFPYDYCLSSNYREVGNTFKKRLGSSCPVIQPHHRLAFDYPDKLQHFNWALIPTD
eukprot:TRINITY_DN4706_c0_g1_i1.p1 TRINITY_DN4706_c0_g1~~TRINITY_DN4706_c0_g1_i1.p1  ORF type:complete len:302 (+),score=58.06 TRINITY_DN4706_c0_g1_i1:119-1024(+)